MDIMTLMTFNTNQRVVNVEEAINFSYFLSQTGAKGDCILDAEGNFVSGTDNTEFINEAIDKTPIGGTLFLPPGMFLCEYIDKVRSDITIQGNNTTIVFSVTPEKSKHALRIIGSNVTLNDINFRYNRPFNYDTTYKPTAFGASNTVRLGGEHPDKPNGGWQTLIKVNRITINGGYSGGLDIYFANNVRINNVDVSNTLGNGLNFANCQRDIKADGVNILNTRDDGIQCVCDSNVPGGTKNYRLYNANVVNSYAKGISTTGVNGGIIKNFYIENTWGGALQPFNDAFYNLGTSVNITCKDGTIVNAGKNYGVGKYKTTRSDNADGIYSSQATEDMLFENIRIRDSARHGVSIINGAKNIRIRDVFVKGARGRGFAIGDTNDTTVKSGFNIKLEGCEVEDVGEYAVSFGGVNEGSIKDCRFSDWGSTSYPVIIRNSAHIETEDNKIVFVDRGIISNLIRVEVSRNITDVNNRLINTQVTMDIPKDSFLIGNKRIAGSNGIPTSFVWNQTDIIFDNSATVGGKVGFWCRRSGRACPTWVANKAYSVGDYVVPTSDNGHAYRCTAAGTSGATAPTWGSATGSTTTDNGVTWLEVGSSALFKPFGAIDA